MNAIIKKALLFSMAAMASCGSSESSGGIRSEATLLQDDPASQIVSLVRQYHAALSEGDSAKAVSMTTGTAQAILQYRFPRLPKGTALLFSYGSPNFRGDTCYLPFTARNTMMQDSESSNKVLLIKVDGEWKIERVVTGN